MGYREVYKNRDIRFRCANYDFKSGHCKVECMIDMYTEENGQKRVVSIPAYPVGCSGDPNCKNFKGKEEKQ